MAADVFTSLGIDLSASATGCVLLSENGKAPKAECTCLIKHPTLTGMDRNRAIIADVMTLIHDLEPSRIVIEGYSLNLKNANSVVALVELGGLLRFMMYLDGLVWYDPRATELKKFVVGKGTAPKDVVMLNVFKRWGFEASDNNIADAYGLAAMGLASANRLAGITLEMRKIAAALVQHKS